MCLNTGTVLAFVAFSLVLTLNGTSASKRISWFDLLEHKLKENRGYGGIMHGGMCRKANLWEEFHLCYVSSVESEREAKQQL